MLECPRDPEELMNWIVDHSIVLYQVNKPYKLGTLLETLNVITLIKVILDHISGIITLTYLK